MPWQGSDWDEPRESGGHPGREAWDNPLEILNGRYASGEITKEEFDQMKSDLA